MAYGVELNVFKISIGGTPAHVKHFLNAFSSSAACGLSAIGCGFYGRTDVVKDRLFRVGYDGVLGGSMSTLRRWMPSVLVAGAAVVLIPGRAAEPDPKAVVFTLPDKIEWRKGAGSDN